MASSTAVVAGALASKPHNGGEAWVRLSWLLGLRRLGFDVVFVEELESCPPDACAWFDEVTRAFGIADRSLLARGEAVAGLSRTELLERLDGAALLVNVSGNLRDDELHSRCRRRVYVDVDPGYTQLWHRAGADVGLERHDLHVTVGLRVGTSGCELPVDGIRWRPLPPPVVLDQWPVVPAPPGRFTTVASWRGGYGRVRNGSTLHGQKAHEFRRLADLPRSSGHVCEAALAIGDSDAADRDRLVDGGWLLVDAASVAARPESFRDYVQGSAAELSPAQGIYVETSCGWIGDRTARYLASGKPAIVQDTGLTAALPTGEGLLCFRTAAEAARAADRVIDGYDAHARAARDLAEQVFDSDRVIGSMLEDAGVSP